MKTPKRFICPTKNVPCLQEKPCFSWEERGIPDRSECARWKRKNRIAQLKRTIARQKRVWKDYLEVIELYFGDEMNTMWWQDQEGS